MRNNAAKEGARIIGDANRLLDGLCAQVRPHTSWLCLWRGIVAAVSWAAPYATCVSMRLADRYLSAVSCARDDLI